MAFGAAGAAFRPKDGVGLFVPSFRGWIARPVRSLSTLRSSDHPETTQDSLIVDGQSFRFGVGYPTGPFKGFCIGFSVHASSFQACLAQPPRN
jgi:hypothetical protein